MTEIAGTLTNAAGEIAQDDYAQWRAHPVTQWFRQYLRDFQSDLIEGVTERWLAGNLTLADEHEMKGRALCLRELADLPFKSISLFYAQIAERERSESEDATETTEDEDSSV